MPMVEVEHDGKTVTATYEYKDGVVEVFHLDLGRSRAQCDFALAASTARTLLREMLSER